MEIVHVSEGPFTIKQILSVVFMSAELNSRKEN